MGAGTVTRKETLLLRQRQTTRQLMGVTRLTEHGAVCGRDELLFYLLRPDNLSILSPEGIRGRVRALTGLLQGMASLELLALDSRESFLKNKQYYQRRLEKQIQDHGFHVRLAGEQDVKRILAVYYQQDVVTEHFEQVDGERWVTDHG